jgi:hypothetical protein
MQFVSEEHGMTRYVRTMIPAALVAAITFGCDATEKDRTVVNEPTPVTVVDFNLLDVETVEKAAWATQRAHRQAGRQSSEIEPEYWAEEIAQLKPIRVYNHMVNIVCVLEETPEAEKGFYIYIPISSYLPMSGDYGFTFLEQRGSIHQYERKRLETPPGGELIP